MEPPKKESLAHDRARPRPKEIHIMMMRSVGKIRSFKISSWTVFLISIFLVVYFPASILTMNAYFLLRLNNDRQLEKLQTLESQLNKTQKDLVIANQRLTLLKTSIEDIEKNGAEPQAATDEAEVLEEGSEQTQLPESSLNTEDTRTGKEEVTIVYVRDMDIQEAGFKVRIDFKLANTQPGEAAVKGYTHILMMDDRMDVPSDWAYPKEEIKNGIPVNYRSGLFFSIKNFKPYIHEFPLKPGQTPPALIKILIYDQSGTIIHDKVFDLNNDT